MIVICRRPTKRLIKGHRYEVQNLWNDGTSQRWREGKVQIKDIGLFTVSGFTDTDGKDLPKTIFSSPPIAHEQRIRFEDLKEGDILVCKSDRYKTFVQNGMYKIEKLITKSEQKTGWNGNTNTIVTNSIKFVGIGRRMKFNAWVFRKLNPTELREISLNHILHGEEVKVITNKDIKNIDLVEDKDDVLLKNLAKSILDINRHHLSIVEWASLKVGDKLDVDPKDYNHLMNLTLAQILEKIK